MNEREEFESLVKKWSNKKMKIINSSLSYFNKLEEKNKYIYSYLESILTLFEGELTNTTIGRNTRLYPNGDYINTPPPIDVDKEVGFFLEITDESLISIEVPKPNEIEYYILPNLKMPVRSTKVMQGIWRKHIKLKEPIPSDEYSYLTIVTFVYSEIYKALQGKLNSNSNNFIKKNPEGFIVKEKYKDVYGFIGELYDLFNDENILSIKTTREDFNDFFGGGDISKSDANIYFRIKKSYLAYFSEKILQEVFYCPAESKIEKANIYFSDKKKLKPKGLSKARNDSNNNMRSNTNLENTYNLFIKSIMKKLENLM